METIKKIYRIGKGPSSSHTMGPFAAAKKVLKEFPIADYYRVTLLGALAATGRGHQTDVAIEEVFPQDKLELIWKPEEFLDRHPNALKFEILNNQKQVIETKIAYSTGGGKIVFEGDNENDIKQIYKLTTMKAIFEYIRKNGMSFWEYVEECEGPDIWDYLDKVWTTMKVAIKKGTETDGVIPGGLKLGRKANSYYHRALMLGANYREACLLDSYALATAEENACGGIIVTAPTCGSCGVVPAILKITEDAGFQSRKNILKALATAGLIGNLVKFNASISGAEVGCQGEIGTACAMAAAAFTQLSGGSIWQIEYAAEMGIEHHLGLTCDPIQGLVQVPCIERNAHAASRALSCSRFATLSDGQHLISFDSVVKVLKETGHALPTIYKETSLGGLATVKEGKN